MFFLFFFSGTEFNYTTHGYTLLSAVIESVSGEPFLKYIQKLFRELGLHNTYLDENGPIIPYRSRYVVHIWYAFLSNHNFNKRSSGLCFDNWGVCY